MLTARSIKFLAYDLADGMKNVNHFDDVKQSFYLFTALIS